MLSSLIFLIIGFLFFLKSYFLAKKELLNPIVLNTLYWYAALSFSIIGSVVFGLYFYWGGLFPILLFVLSFNSGAYIVQTGMKSKKATLGLLFNEKTKFQMINKTKALNAIIVIFSLLGIFALIMQLNFLNLEVHSFKDLFTIANLISVKRYASEPIDNHLILFLTAFLYSASFLGPLTFLNNNKATRLFSVIPLVVAFGISVVNGVRSPFLIMLFTWIASFISVLTYQNKGKLKLKLKNIIVILSLFVFLILFFALIQILRGGNPNAHFSSIFKHLIAFYFGYFNGFSLWWKDYTYEGITYFKYTFSGIHNLFFQERIIGLFSEKVIITDEGKMTNIYMMARGLIEDFSIYGSMIILFVSGIVSSLSYYLLKIGSWVGLFFFALILSILSWSVTTCLLTYNTILLSWMLSFLVLFLLNFKYNTNGEGFAFHSKLSHNG